MRALLMVCLLLSLTVSAHSQSSSAKPQVPIVSGTYNPSQTYPRVFTTQAELNALVARITAPSSYSAARFRDLSAKIKADLQSHIDWNETYSGCRQKTYLFAFSYEPQEAQFIPTLRTDLATPVGSDPPAGAAVVAARLALYAALVQAGAKPPPDAPTAATASVLAKQILLAWADHGFRDASGAFRSLASFTCDDAGKPFDGANAQTGLALSLGRGALYSVQAQDLLSSLHVLDPNETRRLGAFHRALSELIRESSNKFDSNPHLACERYANGQANATAALLAIARLLDDGAAFQAVLRGNGASVAVPWVLLFDRALHGDEEHPPECYPNHGPDALTSRPSYVTAVIAPGEINDRYRNANALQGIGYATFTLERMIDAAEVLRRAGFDPYGYRGAHGQSIQLSLDYYACFGQKPGFGQTVSPGDAASCRNGAQYLGKVVDGVDRLVVFGAGQFSADLTLDGLEPAAKVAARNGPFSTDALLFGKWRD